MTSLKIKIIDYNSINSFHEIINLAFIDIFSSIFEEVYYISGKSAQLNNKKITKEIKGVFFENVRYKRLFTIETDTRLMTLIRHLWGFFTTLYYYFIIDRRDVIFYNYTNYFSLPIICLLNHILHKKVIFTFHGELELFTSQTKFFKPSALYKLLLKIGFKHCLSGSFCKGLVLGDSIRTNILCLYPHISKEIISICHPYYFKNNNQTIKSQNQFPQPLRIGTIGSMNKNKGLMELIEVSLRLQPYIQSSQLEIFCIGKINDKNVKLPSNIQLIGSKNGLSREEYEKCINKLNYILYLYPTHSYKLTASGAIMDAIKSERPIISLKNDFFSYLLHNSCPGFLEDSIDELIHTIEKIIQNKSIPNFQKEFSETKHKIDIRTNAILLEKQINDLIIR